MKYVENNLIPNEEILFTAKVHWIIYLKTIVIILILLPILLSIYPPIAFLPLLLLIPPFIFTKTTELVITSKRVIAKFGLIRRDTIELNHSQVESLMVEQGVIDRVVNAGTILIQGTGGSKTPIPLIANPLNFRKEFYNIVENHK